MTTSTLERPWYVFAELPSGERLVPGETPGCGGPDAWGVCPALDAGRTPICAEATWSYGPAPTWRFEVRTISSTCPLVRFDPLVPAATAAD